MNPKKKVAGLVAAIALAAVLGLWLSMPSNSSPDASTDPPLSATSTPQQAQAVNYVNDRMGSTTYDGYCQRLVREAYASAGIDITATASDNSSAQRFWDTTSLTKHPATEPPPAGALVFWAADSYNPDGHVGISLGDDKAASSEERDNKGVHVFSISARNQTKQMLGWVMP